MDGAAAKLVSVVVEGGGGDGESRWRRSTAGASVFVRRVARPPHMRGIDSPHTWDAVPLYLRGVRMRSAGMGQPLELQLVGVSAAGADGHLGVWFQPCGRIVLRQHARLL